MDPTATIQQIPLTQIVAGANDRKQFKGIPELAASIKAQGLKQPPTVRMLADGRAEIVMGERRYRAYCYLANEAPETYRMMPCLVDTLDDYQARIGMLVENTGRVNLNPIEEASAYQRLIDLDHKTPAQIAELGSVSEATVRNRLLLLNLCDELQDLTQKGVLGLQYAQAIGRAGLDRNFQLRAVSELQANAAPTIRWFGGLLDELLARQGECSMFDLDTFLASPLQAAQLAKQADPPLPGKQQAPTTTGTAVEIVQAQIAYWHDAADAWTARGHKRNAERCQDAAQGLAAVAIALSATLPPATAPEPAETPTETTIDPLPMLLAILSERQPRRDTSGLQIEAYTPFRVKGKIVAQRCDGATCRNLPTHRVTGRDGAQLRSRLLCSECLECVTIGA